MRMRVTDKIGRHSFPYRTRTLRAGDEFEVRPGDETALRQLPFFEDVTAATQTYSTRMLTAETEAPRRRGRPPAAARLAAASKADEYEEPAAAEAPAEPQPTEADEPSDAGDPFPSLNVPALREMAEERGIELPSGYVPRAELIKLLQEAGQATS
jgi:hypothetical protein